MAGTEVAAPAITAEEAAIAYRAILDGELPEGFGAAADPEATARAIAQRIIDAESFDDVFGEQGLRSWQDEFLDVPVLVKTVRLNPSTKQEGGLYAVVDIEPLDGSEAAQVACGGRNVLAQLVKMVERGWQDKPVKLTATKAASGNDVLRLQAA